MIAISLWGRRSRASLIRLEHSGITGSIESQASMFGDFLKMIVDRVEAHLILYRDGCDQHVEPGNGQAAVAESPGEGDGPLPVVIASGPIGDHGKMSAETDTLLPSRSAENFEPHRGTPLGLVGIEQRFRMRRLPRHRLADS